MTGSRLEFYDSEDGLELACRVSGDGHGGTPVICLPGITRNSRDFEDLAPRLASRRPVYCPDLRGRGHSAHDPDWRNYRPQTYVGDVRRLLEVFGIPRATFVGTSLGGLVSMLLALEAPQSVAGIVLNDIGPIINPAGLERIKSYIGRMPPVADWPAAAAQARELYGPTLPELDDDDWLRLARRGYREDGAGRPVLDFDPMIGEAARKVGAGLDDPWALFDKIRDIPLLLVQGELSDILTDDIVAGMRERKPDLEHVVAANRGHVPLLDEGDVLPALERFVESAS